MGMGMAGFLCFILIYLCTALARGLKSELKQSQSLAKLRESTSLVSEANCKSIEHFTDVVPGVDVSVYGHDGDGYYFPCNGLVFIKAKALFEAKHPELEFMGILSGQLLSSMGGSVGSDGPIVFYKKKN